MYSFFLLKLSAIYADIFYPKFYSFHKFLRITKTFPQSFDRIVLNQTNFLPYLFEIAEDRVVCRVPKASYSRLA